MVARERCPEKDSSVGDREHCPEKDTFVVARERFHKRTVSINHKLPNPRLRVIRHKAYLAGHVSETDTTF